MAQNITNLKNDLNKLTQFIKPLLSLANSHMVDFFTENNFKNFVDKDIQQEIEEIGPQLILKSLFNNTKEELCPHLHKFILNCRENSLENIEPPTCFGLKTFQNELTLLGRNNSASGLRLEVFMTSKKSHEVEVLTEIISRIAEISKTKHFVDIGDGKGYLSSALALNNGFKVLGIDSSNVNTNSAAKRVKKLNKHWKNVTKDKEKNNSDLYKQITQYVTEDAVLSNLVTDQFNEMSDNISIVGLHTCGDLSPTCIRLFIKDTSIKSICNIGCCYHLITEEKDGQDGFPLSQFLKDQNFTLGRNARMLSCQSIDRILDKKELPSKILFYRSLLQILILKYSPELVKKQVGKYKNIGNACTFPEYVKLALKKFQTDVLIPEEEILKLYNLYLDQEIYLHIFYLLRANIAPVIEGIILMDRLLFLKENCVTTSYLVKLFDPVISPRCYGIIGIKDLVE